jgi:hypothetical protein
MSEQARREDPTVIQNEDVAGSKMFGQTAKVIVTRSASASIQNQHARRGAVRERLLRNELFGKMEIEVRDEHFDDCTKNGFTTEARRTRRKTERICSAFSVFPVARSQLDQFSYTILNDVLPGDFAAIWFASCQ